jgi:hypothetical protein
MREELVLKVAILAEKFAPDVQVREVHTIVSNPHTSSTRN